MKIIKDENFNKVTASKGKHIRAVNDEYIPEHEEDGVLISEHFPYYSELLYLPATLSEDEIREMYIEETKDYE